MLKNLFKNYWEIAVIVMIAFICTRSLFTHNFYPMHDDTQPTRVFEMAHALQDGMFPVRWSENLGYGYGYPIFNFYAPFAYYVGAAIYFLGFGLIPATKIMIGLPIFFAGFGMYLFIRSVLGRVAGIVSSSMYMLFPYAAVNIFVRGAVGEIYAYALLPFVFWGACTIYYRVNNSQIIQWKWIYITSVAAALLIISHNLSALMTSVYILLFSLLCLAFSHHKKQLFLHFALVGVLAFFLSAFYLIPAFGEMEYTNVRSQIGGGADYTDHFVCLGQLWNSQWGFGGSTPGCVDGMSFRLGKTNVLFFFSAVSVSAYIWVTQRKKIQNKLVIMYALVLGVFSVFMLTQYSAFLWNLISTFEYIQYPWRFLTGVGFAMAIIIGYGIYILSKISVRYSFIVAGLLIAVTIGINAKLFYPQSEKTVTAADYSNTVNVRYTISKISDEYLPQSFRKPASEKDVPKTIFEFSQDGQVDVTESKTTYHSAHVSVQEPSLLHINITYFPAWNVYVDKKPVTYGILPSGLQVRIPEGNHFVEVQYHSTPIEKVGNTLSILAIGVMLLGIIRSYVKKTS